MKKVLLLLFCSMCFYSFSQEYFPTNKGVKTSKNSVFAFTNARIYVTHNRVLENATLVIKDGKVTTIGKNVSIPKTATKINLSGKTIYPSFVETYSSFGIPKINRSSNHNYQPQYDAERKGYYWNDHIRPDMDASQVFNFNKKKAEELLKSGFGVVNTHIEDGIMQGNGILVALNAENSDDYNILNKKSGNYLSFAKSKKSRQAYPTSLMGAIALIRQTYLDSKWYNNGNSKTTDLALEALENKKNLQPFFNAGSYANALRADKLGDEFGIQYTIVGGGDEYKRIDAIKNTNANFIIPINFRKAYDVTNPYYTRQISLADMRAWNQEPTNPSVLSKNGIRFALTTKNLKSLRNFKTNLLKAIEYGLSKEKALESLTSIPAELLKNSKIGNLNNGSYANFLITSGDIFDKNTILYENWVLGNKYVVQKMDEKDISGKYLLTVNGKNYDLEISKTGKTQKATVKQKGKVIKSKFSLANNWFNLSLNDNNNFLRLMGKTNRNTLEGKTFNSSGEEGKWFAKKSSEKTKTDKKKAKGNTHIDVVATTYPNIAFGNKEKPKQQTILIKNATIWTGEDENFVLKNSDILLKNGKIQKIGTNLSASGAKVIDATGKYVTSGIIDEHSHIATAAVNEAGHNSTAEVSIEDVIDADNINIYRNLAGGVTSIQILHGSANPIGGRSAIIKLKWGENTDKLIYKNSPKFIKFALGENVKQSNWGDFSTVRFPQTRMGVEQVYMDYFQRAKEYGKAKASGNYRKDIELETLLEIINGERFISCHSYIQSEINMLMKVGEKFGFRINTFTHILEGYKLADKMKKHGAGASTFSDWWAYKYEVNDAIPYNAAILHKQGVVTAINSDDAEMSRRLNQEAAKTIKYGGVSEHDAWKMVTINAAKLLHLDNRTGSLKVGKDADVVVWSENPLSIYSKALTTIVDGTIYFDIEDDKQKRKEMKAEKAKLIDLMLKEKIGGAETQSPKKKKEKHFHCDTE